jgi:hypothetical protein
MWLLLEYLELHVKYAKVKFVTFEVLTSLNISDYIMTTGEHQIGKDEEGSGRNLI